MLSDVWYLRVVVDINANTRITHVRIVLKRTGKKLLAIFFLHCLSVNGLKIEIRPHCCWKSIINSNAQRLFIQKMIQITMIEHWATPIKWMMKRQNHIKLNHLITLFTQCTYGLRLKSKIWHGSPPPFSQPARVIHWIWCHWNGVRRVSAK